MVWHNSQGARLNELRERQLVGQRKESSEITSLDNEKSATVRALIAEAELGRAPPTSSRRTILTFAYLTRACVLSKGFAAET